MSTESYDADAYVVELRARIRELEAELGRSREATNEARRWLSRAEKAEARVAELERHADENCGCQDIVPEGYHKDLGTGKWTLPKGVLGNALLLSGAREREEG